MSRRTNGVWSWVKAMKNAFSRRKPANRVLLQVQALEDRLAPASFSPSPGAIDGAADSLRAAIIAANTNGAASNTIYLRPGVYNLTIANIAGQENAAATGDLDLTGFNKTYIFKGFGPNSSIISADDPSEEFEDRVFQILPGVKVEFRNLAIRGGEANDNGVAGVLPDTTSGFGGGILATGADIRLINTLIDDNHAHGGDGIDGAGGEGGTAGHTAAGGGIYASNTVLRLQDSSRITNNLAFGGRGGDGGDEIFDGSTNVVGAGGNGGAAQGGGVYLTGGFLAMATATIFDNEANGGGGGQGGSGGNDVTGGTGGSGGIAQGGGIYAESANLNLNHQTGGIQQNFAFGGRGGTGGNEGTPSGGQGGEGGEAQGGGIFAVNGVFNLNFGKIGLNEALGGTGGTGGRGSQNDSGGDGGAGGNASGGGLYLDVAAPNITNSVISLNGAEGGTGGNGGQGGAQGTESLSGGQGGIGGTARGGGLFIVTSNLTAKINISAITSNRAEGGEGGTGGAGGTNDSENDDLFGGAGGEGGFALGAGLFVAEGTVKVSRTTISDNVALGGEGGEGGNGGVGADPDLGNTSLAGGAGNLGGGALGGGAYVASSGTLFLFNSTVANNTAQGGFGGEGGAGGAAFDTSLGNITDVTTGASGTGGTGGNGLGGGLYNDGGTLNLYNSTIAFNDAIGGAGGAGGAPGGPGGAEGGGVFGAGAEFAFSTIFSDNTALDGPDFFGNLEATACLFGDSSDTVIIGGSANLLDALANLGPLTTNGGPTFTIALMAGSAAIDKGTNPLKLTTDQRGFTRVKGAKIDIGAFEVQ